ncbi:MAG: LysM peptidoglycan-binding domain-containing protein [Caldilineaceae bacterium]
MRFKKLFQKVALVVGITLLLIGSYAGMTQGRTALAAVPQVSLGEPIIYMVQRGDSLSTIAQRYGTSVQALMKLNQLCTTVIYVGQPITIATEQIPGTGIDTRYTVQRGDTLSALAVRFNTTVQSIMNANGLHSSTIYVGQVLIMPRDFPIPTDTTTYVVQAGDWLSKLAIRFNTTVADLMQINHLPSTTLYVGQVLQVPQGAGEPTPMPSPTPNGNPGPFPPPVYERIEVSLDAPLARVRGQVRVGNPKRYVVHGMAGETLTISLSAPGLPENASGIAVYAMPRDGGAATGEQAPPTPGSLPSSRTEIITSDGDLVIQVDATTAQAVDYELFIAAKPSTSPTGCATDNDALTLYQEPNGSYCLLYPSRFHLGDEVQGRIGIYGPPLDQSMEPLAVNLSIEHVPANGTPLQLAVDYYIQNNSNGTNLTRQTMLLGDEAAEVVEGLPGQTGSRQIFVVHGGEFYHLTFYPVDPAFPQVEPDLQALWSAVTTSLVFLR